ncbi:hypothetical protein UM91_18510 [Pseudomonas oryzihabitans]|nr:hypothetical protein UM91_18510 [Pseudomonas oryzihabitans]
MPWHTADAMSTQYEVYYPWAEVGRDIDTLARSASVQQSGAETLDGCIEIYVPDRLFEYRFQTTLGGLPG